MNNDDEALKHFNEMIKFNDGRYQITLPWKGDEFSLSDNYSVAIARMKMLIHRLQADKDLLHKYDEIIQQQIRNNIIEEVDVTKPSETKKYYLPHHPILTPDKETTKIRIVYDASAKAKSTASSLNECLLRGPIILPDLCGLLLRFRLYELVLLADVEKAFLQIGIQERERDVTRFLWLRDIHSATMSESNLVVYRFCRVPFGLICSPFLLGATLKFHLQDEDTPLALNILNNMYVDNVLMGTDSVEEAYCIYQKAKIIFKKASMNLRQWNSNSEEFLKSLPPGERSLGNTNVMKVLGIMWDRVIDVIRIPGFDSSGNIKTKREVLHCIAKIFDPLGLLAPVSLIGKLFLQKLWKINQPWDEPLSQDLSTEWSHIFKMLVEIPSLSICRIVKCSNIRMNQLLIFSDACTLLCHCCVFAIC